MKLSCMGCAALVKQDDHTAWKAGCALGYKSEVRKIKYVLPVPVPLENCPKPMTIKRYLEIIKGLSVGEAKHRPEIAPGGQTDRFKAKEAE